MKYIIIYILLMQYLIAFPVVTMNKTTYDLNDFYHEYGKKEWEGADTDQKKELINDFINRRLAALEAKNIGLDNKPDIAEKLYNREQAALVNITYEELVAKPLVSKELLNKTRKHIIEERLLSHIVISHSTAKIQNPPDRTIDDAYLLAQKISNDLQNNENFIDYALKYSEDPTVFQNKGRLDWISWGRTIPSFQESAFLLEKGTISKPVLTDFGYHIIFCEDIRPSEYAELDEIGLEKIIHDISMNSIRNKLRPAASKYDSTQLANCNIQYNNSALEKILNKISSQNNKNKISGQHKIDLIDLFNEMSDIGPVAVFNKKGYGIKWFGERLRMIPSGRHPRIDSLESLEKAFNIIILQYLAIDAGYSHNIHNSQLYEKQKTQIHQSLLYDQYLKWVVNNAPVPDSLDIQQYYKDNKEEKYLEGPKVSIREIKVLNKDLADSLLLELQYDADFEEIARLYSKTNPYSGGLIPPFTKGKYNQMGAIAFNLKEGELSGVIMNLDRTYSIILLEQIINSEYIPIEKVYNRIESIIKRNNQTDIKQNAFKNLQKKFNVIINSGVYNH